MYHALGLEYVNLFSNKSFKLQGCHLEKNAVGLVFCQLSPKDNKYTEPF